VGEGRELFEGAAERDTREEADSLGEPEGEGVDEMEGESLKRVGEPEILTVGGRDTE